MLKLTDEAIDKVDLSIALANQGRRASRPGGRTTASTSRVPSKFTGNFDSGGAAAYSFCLRGERIALF